MLPSPWLFWTLTVFRRLAAAPVDVQIITILPYDFTTATAVVWTGAAFELAVEAANRKYAPFLNVSVRFMYNSSHRNCDDLAGDHIRMLSEYYYRQTNNESVYGLVVSRTSF